METLYVFQPKEGITTFELAQALAFLDSRSNAPKDTLCSLVIEAYFKSLPENVKKHFYSGNVYETAAHAEALLTDLENRVSSS